MDMIYSRKIMLFIHIQVKKEHTRNIFTSLAGKSDEIEADQCQ